MSAGLSPDSESFIASEIALGAFESRDDAIEAGIALLKKRRELIEKLDEGHRQLEAGEYVEFDEDGLRQFFAGLKERATSKRASA
jgi:Arc/MetJ-type ribon-helix-helix transcriptional regulator